jgi:16S rRNA (adenine1518-N6/adenine1519-N6)-dimethyltransferase
MDDIQHNTETNFIAKKSLGQNFLHAPQVISRMVHEAGVAVGDTILEVGPGKGALTEKLLVTGAKVLAVEKDDRAIPFLSEKFKKEIEAHQLILIHGDILEFEPGQYGLSAGNYTIVANIPYYISGEFLQKFFEAEEQPRRIVVMLQKELAKRIVDEKGSILSISVKAYGNPKYITTVPRKFFRPIPNVDSAVLLIDSISKNFFTFDEKFFFSIIKTGFAHKRKVLIKNLEEKIDPNHIKNLWENEKWSLTIRAEELKLADWKKIVMFAERFPQKSL